MFRQRPGVVVQAVGRRCLNDPEFLMLPSGDIPTGSFNATWQSSSFAIFDPPGVASVARFPHPKKSSDDCQVALAWHK